MGGWGALLVKSIFGYVFNVSEDVEQLPLRAEDDFKKLLEFDESIGPRAFYGQTCKAAVL
jgi:hypothetical protein